MKKDLLPKLLVLAAVFAFAHLIHADENLKIKRKPTKLNFNSLIEESSLESSSLSSSINDQINSTLTDWTQKSEKQNRKPNRAHASEPLDVDMGMGDTSPTVRNNEYLIERDTSRLKSRKNVRIKPRTKNSKGLSLNLPVSSEMSSIETASEDSSSK